MRKDSIRPRSKSEVQLTAPALLPLFVRFGIYEKSLKLTLIDVEYLVEEMNDSYWGKSRGIQELSNSLQEIVDESKPHRFRRLFDTATKLHQLIVQYDTFSRGTRDKFRLWKRKAVCVLSLCRLQESLIKVVYPGIEELTKGLLYRIHEYLPSVVKSLRKDNETACGRIRAEFRKYVETATFSHAGIPFSVCRLCERPVLASRFKNHVSNCEKCRSLIETVQDSDAEFLKIVSSATCRIQILIKRSFVQTEAATKDTGSCVSLAPERLSDNALKGFNTTSSTTKNLLSQTSVPRGITEPMTPRLARSLNSLKPKRTDIKHDDELKARRKTLEKVKSMARKAYEINTSSDDDTSATFERLLEEAGELDADPGDNAIAVICKNFKQALREKSKAFPDLIEFKRILDIDHDLVYSKRTHQRTRTQIVYKSCCILPKPVIRKLSPIFQVQEEDKEAECETIIPEEFEGKDKEAKAPPCTIKFDNRFRPLNNDQYGKVRVTEETESLHETQIITMLRRTKTETEAGKLLHDNYKK